MKLHLDIFDNQSKEIPTTGLRRLAELIWTTEADCDGEIRVILVDDEQLLQINQEFLNHDYQTDVLSFPLRNGEGESFEGEIYISVDRVYENAATYMVTAGQELQRTMTHGILHFLGYDDNSAADKRTMTARENFYLGSIAVSQE